MPKDSQTTSNDTKASHNEKKSETLHTCACGEQHEDIPGSPSHQDACESPLKFGNTCCCGSGDAAKGKPHRCGHGPRCH